MVILFAQLQPGPWMYAVPVFGQNLHIMTLLQGGPVPWLALGLGAVATLALAVAVIAVAVKRFVPHKVLFS
jgi:hypothetical protein